MYTDTCLEFLPEIVQEGTPTVFGGGSFVAILLLTFFPSVLNLFSEYSCGRPHNAYT